MAVDTENKRRSIIRLVTLGLRPILPVANGAVSSGDRAMISGRGWEGQPSVTDDTARTDNGRPGIGISIGVSID